MKLAILILFNVTLPLSNILYAPQAHAKEPPKKSQKCASFLLTSVQTILSRSQMKESTQDTLNFLETFKTFQLRHQTEKSSLGSVFTSSSSRNNQKLKVAKRINGILAGKSKNKSGPNSSLYEKFFYGHRVDGVDAIRSYFQSHTENWQAVSEGHARADRDVLFGGTKENLQLMVSLMLPALAAPLVGLELLSGDPSLPDAHTLLWSGWSLVLGPETWVRFAANVDLSLNRKENYFKNTLEQSIEQPIPNSWVYRTFDYAIPTRVIEGALNHRRPGEYLRGSEQDINQSFLEKNISASLGQTPTDFSFVHVDHLMSFDQENRPSLTVFVRSTRKRVLFPSNSFSIDWKKALEFFKDPVGAPQPFAIRQ